MNSKKNIHKESSRVHDVFVHDQCGYMSWNPGVVLISYLKLQMSWNCFNIDEKGMSCNFVKIFKTGECMACPKILQFCESLSWKFHFDGYALSIIFLFFFELKINKEQIIVSFYASDPISWSHMGIYKSFRVNLHTKWCVMEMKCNLSYYDIELT